MTSNKGRLLNKKQHSKMKKTILISLLSFFISSLGFNLAIAQVINSEVNFERHAYLPAYSIKKIANPEIFQGNKKRKKYFEGWYFKMVSADGSSILSVIPGISLSQNGEEQHAFIQMIDGKTAESFYYTYPIDEFAFSKKDFEIRIGDNYFSEEKVILDIQNDSTSISGDIRMSDLHKLSLNKNRKKRIMGWYRFVPFMQCYHGVVSLTHDLNGSLVKDDKTYNFDHGLGYIEKDWGKSMPSDWIWIQSNNFNSENSSFMLSIANIPWMGRSFTGFLGFFLHDSTVQRFGTYTNAKFEVETSNSDTIRITIKDKALTYHIETYRSKAGVLKAPVEGSMDRRISESIDAKLFLKVMDNEANIIFSDSTSIAGLETVGDIKSLSTSDR